MPYIPQEERPELDPSIRLLVKDLSFDFSGAALNYVYSCLANAYIKHHGLRYAYIKDVQGVYVGALDEFNVHVARPYEKIKLEENGTVWDCMDTEPTPLTDADIEALMIHDETTGQHWMKCLEPDCALKLVAPGRVSCEHCTVDEDVIE